MQTEIKVHVVAYPGRKNLVMRYKCPETGKQIARTTGTHQRGKAVKVAAKWEAELQEGRYQRTTRMSWDEFCNYVEAHHLITMSRRSKESYMSTLDVFAAECSPQRLSDVTTAKVTGFRTALASKGRRPATIAKHLRTLAAILRWAKVQGLVAVVPDCTIPKGSKVRDTMKGRPITTEEFERMLAATDGVVGASKADDWKFYLRALWGSGLRLSESLTLTWDYHQDALSIDMAGRRPMFRIPAAVEKGKRNRLLPIPPEFAELLATIPEGKRRGRVFRVHEHPVNVSAVVSSIGKAAGVVVRPAVGKKGETGYKAPKFASAHDLRRSFGTRWSRKLSPARLMAIMRHEDISTTMRFYVSEQADDLADALWEGFEVTEATEVTL